MYIDEIMSDEYVNIFVDAAKRLKDINSKTTVTGSRATGLTYTLKDTNPKDQIGCKKLPIHLWPETATIMGSLALLEGACKYGAHNYRGMGIRASIYVSALRRHMLAWWNGEDCDPDSGLHHFSHMLACLAIMVDANAAEMMEDDRPPSIGIRDYIEEATDDVPRIIEKYKDMKPKHWTIHDEEPERQ